MKIRLSPIRMSKLILASSLGKSTQLKKKKTQMVFSFPYAMTFNKRKMWMEEIPNMKMKAIINNLYI